MIDGKAQFLHGIAMRVNGDGQALPVLRRSAGVIAIGQDDRGGRGPALQQFLQRQLWHSGIGSTKTRPRRVRHAQQESSTFTAGA